MRIHRYLVLPIGLTDAPLDTGLDPQLGPLANNGGPTQTHALKVGSPAIDKGKNFATDASNNPILTDQRGLTRPVDLDDSIKPNAAGTPSTIGLATPLAVRSPAQSTSGATFGSPSSKRVGRSARTSSVVTAPSRMISESSWPSAGECMTPWPDEPLAR